MLWKQRSNNVHVFILVFFSRFFSSMKECIGCTYHKYPDKYTDEQNYNFNDNISINIY